MNVKAALPVILTITGCIATVGAVILSAIETPGAIETIDNHRLEIDPSGDSDLCTKEKVVDYAKSYKKTIACTAVAMASIIGSCVAGSSNYRTLLKSSTAIAAGSTAYISKYRNKVKKMIGEEKEKLLNKQVRDEMKYEHDHFNDTATFVYEFKEDDNGVPIYDPIIFKSSLKNMYDYRDDLLYSLSDDEVRSVGEAFPQLRNAIPKDDPRQSQLDLIWYQELLWGDYSVTLPRIVFDPINFKGSEYKDCRQSPDINNGQPAYLIRCIQGPEPPEYLMTADC